MRALMVAAVLAECAAGQIYATHTPQYGYEVVHAYPHDRGAFTEGLFT